MFFPAGRLIVNFNCRGISKDFSTGFKGFSSNFGDFRRIFSNSKGFSLNLRFFLEDFFKGFLVAKDF